ncbi:MAG: type II secretion system protein GspL [Thermodesulfobacteriota bacterium]|nr:type II secretion system protein GspL [Thermodesulfobacteriota bacterium]
MDGNILGIDIRRSDVCAVFAGVYGSERRVEAHASIPLANRDCWECVADAVEAIKRYVDVTGAFCVASLPDDWVSYRIVRMPFTDRRKIEKVIAFELEPLLPFPLGEVVIDFVVGPSSQENDDGADVLAALTARDRLNNFIEGFSRVGLEPSMIIPRGYAAAAVLSTYQDKSILVDADERGGTIAAIHDGLPLFVRSFQIKGGMDDEAVFRKIGAQIRHTLIACREAWAGNGAPERAFVTGNDITAEPFAKMIEKDLALPAMPMNMTEDTAMLGTGRPDLQWQAGRMDVALCLALLKQAEIPLLNFRKGEFSITRKWRQFIDIFAKTGILALLVLVLVGGGFFYELHQASQTVSEMEARINAIFQESFPDVQQIVDPVAQMKSRIKALQANSGLTDDMDRGVYAIDILNEISRLIPQDLDVVVSRFVTGPDDVVLSGHTDAFNSVDTIKNRLEESVFFSSIEITSANMDRADNRVHFKLRVTLQ